jgi:hypothetical protein
MAKYILLANWTDQGMRNIKGSAKRLNIGLTLAKQQGCVSDQGRATTGFARNACVRPSVASIGPIVGVFPAI